MAIRFRDRAAACWRNYQYQRYQDHLLPLEDWGDLKREMNREFLPLNYKQTLFRQFQSLTQGSKSVDDYTLEFYKLAARNQLNESEDQRVARYMQGLRSSIQDALIAHTFYSVSEAQAKAKAVEQHHSRGRPFTSRAHTTPTRTPGDNSKWSSTSDKSSSSTGIFPSSGQQNTSQAANPNPNQTARADRRANIRCHKCQTLGHYANECPNARVHFADEQEDMFEDDLWDPNEEIYEARPDDVMGDCLVARRLCLAPSIKEN